MHHVIWLRAQRWVLLKAVTNLRIPFQELWKISPQKIKGKGSLERPSSGWEDYIQRILKK
jgi:hypothetical protein